MLRFSSAFTSINAIRSSTLQNVHRSQHGLSTHCARTIVHARAHIDERDTVIVKLFRDLEDSDLRAIFDKLDVDRSGIITSTDWQSALKNMGVASPTKEYSNLLSCLDFNKDGHVDFTDFQRSVNQLRQRFPITNEEASATLEQWLNLNEKGAVQSPSDGVIDTVLTSLIRKTVSPIATRPVPLMAGCPLSMSTKSTICLYMHDFPQYFMLGS